MVSLLEEQGPKYPNVTRYWTESGGAWQGLILNYQIFSFACYFSEYTAAEFGEFLEDIMPEMAR
jgi:hypothetical protein